MLKYALYLIIALLLFTSPGFAQQAVGLVPCAAAAGGSITCSIADTNSAAFQGVVSITPGTPVSAARSIGFVVTATGTVTFTLADGSTIALTMSASPSFQTLPFAVTNVALGAGAAGTFWNLK